MLFLYEDMAYRKTACGWHVTLYENDLMKFRYI